MKTRMLTGLLVVFGIFTALPGSARAACDPVGKIQFICGLMGPEDLVIIPGSKWVIATGAAVPGHLYLIDSHDKSLAVLYAGDNPRIEQDTKLYGDCPGPVDAKPGLFVHGIDIRRGPNGIDMLYMVNHSTRESIEIFKIDTNPKMPTATWVGCVIFPPDMTGNGVTPLPHNGFAATNYLPASASKLPFPVRFQKITAGEVTGDVQEWHPGTGWKTVPNSAMSGPNGIEASKDGKFLYVAGTGTRNVVRFSLGENPVRRDDVSTDMATDNLKWGTDGLLWAAGNKPLPSESSKCLGTPDCVVPGVIVKIDPKTLKIKQTISNPGVPVFRAGASTAILVGDEIWVGDGIADRIARLPAQ